MKLSVFKRSFLTGAWLGWQIESNWTDPFLFAVYSIVKPLSGAAILVVMYSLVTNGAFESPVFGYLYYGNAFYQYVGAVITGVSWAVIDDREHYKTLKYIYTAPISAPFYLLGRGMARILVASLSVIITITFGALFLKVPFVFANVNWLLLLITLVVGIIMLTMFGLILAGVTFLLARHTDMVGEVVAGGMYLFVGAIFPLEALPVWMRPVGYALPVTYWLELMRRAVLGSYEGAFPTFAALNNTQLMGILLAMTVVYGVFAVFFFRYCDHRAREIGAIDQVTNY